MYLSGSGHHPRRVSIDGGTAADMIDTTNLVVDSRYSPDGREIADIESPQREHADRLLFVIRNSQTGQRIKSFDMPAGFQLPYNSFRLDPSLDTGWEVAHICALVGCWLRCQSMESTPVRWPTAADHEFPGLHCCLRLVPGWETTGLDPPSTIARHRAHQQFSLIHFSLS
jgi:hypothetical protein